MKKPTENEKRDYDLYYNKPAEEGFSAERNNAIVEKTIKDYEAMRIAKAKQHNNNIDERGDAAYYFIKYLERGGNTGSAAEKYFGKRELARLQGKKIMKRIYGDQIILEEVN